MPIRPEWWIATRLYFSDHDRRSARPAVRVALAGIIIGVMVMIVTLSVVVGFKSTITDKVAGFGSHIQLVSFDSNLTYEMQPVVVGDSLLSVLQAMPHVRSVHRFVTKPGILKTDSAFHGMVLKGTDYWDYFAACLSEGALPSAPNEVLVSSTQASLLGLHVGDRLNSYFVDSSIRARRLQVSGIYDTGFSDFDRLFVLGGLSLGQRLNGWDSTQVSGAEVLLDDVRHLDEVSDCIYYATLHLMGQDEHQMYYVQTLHQLNPQIFAWLDLLDMNVVIILLLMLAVSGFNMVSGLIILILDSVSLIGTLKALGASNRFVRRVFVAEASWLVLKGLGWGNVLGLGLCALQYFTHFLPLDAATYYVNYVPMAFPVTAFALLDLGVMLLSVLILMAPSAVAARISPARVMHFE